MNKAIPDERALIGWEAMAAMVGISKSKMRGYREDLRKAQVIYQIRTRNGYWWAAFPSRLKGWVSAKAEKNEAI